MKHAHIFSAVPMLSSSLGWILQQSDSYKSEHFKCETRFLSETKIDPWDNHVDFTDDADDWSRLYIEEIERNDDDFSWLNGFVDGFTDRSIFGLSYGDWRKSVPWNNESIDTIYINPTDRLFNLFYESYEKRTITPDELIHSMNTHIHDHKQDDAEYRANMMKHMYPTALKYAERGELEFWQLQHCFHHGGNAIPSPEEITTIIAEIKDDIMTDSKSYLSRTSTLVIDDLFNLDLEVLCKDLDIVYNSKMTAEYKKFINYATNIVQV